MNIFEIIQVAEYLKAVNIYYEVTDNQIVIAIDSVIIPFDCSFRDALNKIEAYIHANYIFKTKNEWGEQYNMKYKIGDTVEIKNDLVTEVLYDGYVFADQMKKYNKVTIKDFNVFYGIYWVEENDFMYTHPMIKGKI